MQLNLTARFLPTFLILLSVCAAASSGIAQELSATTARFERDVYAVLKKACFECHGSDKQAGGLRLDQRAMLLDSGTVVAHQPADSELLRRISLPKKDPEVMPAIGEPLSESEVDAIRKWIEAGAVWPEDFEPQQHWSYVRPVRPEIPETHATNWPRNAIDHFVAGRMQSAGLAHSAEADPEVLLRRVYFSLIGLPPTPAEVRAFVAQHSDADYEAVIDHLLQRPEFGERWARPWLDVARYADSHGFQRDDLREIWAYRDWVIRALNADMPFDQFTLEQIAGDLLPEATEDQKIATGFHRCTPTNVEAGSLPEETRIEQVIDRVNTTAAVWLGTTMECCQCHDHKYDPFSAAEYYELLAFFNNTQAEADRSDPEKPSSIRFLGPTMPITSAKKVAQRSLLVARQKTLSQQLKQRNQELAADLDTWAVQTIESDEANPQTHVLEVVQFRSQGTTDSHQILEDGSILLTGSDPPDTDVYEVTVRMHQQKVSAFQLDTLTHPTLPGSGPGRGDGKRSNFVLNRLTAERQLDETADASESDPLVFTTAVADFSQQNWDVTGALNDAAKTGWAIAPEFAKPHWARFILKQRMSSQTPQLITFRLHQQFGSARTIGRLRLSAVTGDPTAAAVSEQIVRLMKTPSDKWSDKQRQTLLDFRTRLDATVVKLQAEMEDLKTQLTKLQPDTTLVMVEMAEPRESFVFERGDYRNPGAAVKPGTPAVLHPFGGARPDRVGLARWLVDPANPLVARVTVNRLWGEVFGQPLVTTPEDFGIKGDQPSHPQLLDWLAVEFVEGGWSVKRLLKTIVLSSTYRQSSDISAESMLADDRNQWLSRGARFRMDAEMIRDNLLAASGLLSLKKFGPPIRPWQPPGIWTKVGGQAYDYKVSPGDEQHRRGIYVVLKRGAPYPSFVNFDASARLSCTIERSRSSTPLQALTLLNDPVYVQAAQALAVRVHSELPDADTQQQLDYAFMLCTARNPTSSERGVLRDLLETQHSINRSQPKFSAAVQDSIKVPEQLTDAEFAAWCSVTTALINLHETITQH